MFYFLYINLAFVLPRDLFQQNEKNDTKINKKGRKSIEKLITFICGDIFSVLLFNHTFKPSFF